MQNYYTYFSVNVLKTQLHQGFVTTGLKLQNFGERPGKVLTSDLFMYTMKMS